MTYNGIYRKFEQLFPNMANRITDKWYPEGKHSIRIDPGYHARKLLFTYYSDREWKLESYYHFMNRKEK